MYLNDLLRLNNITARNVRRNNASRIRFYRHIVYVIKPFGFNHCRKLTPCMDSDVDTSKFWTPPHILNNLTQLDCSCSIGTMECPEMSERMKPPKVQVKITQ